MSYQALYRTYRPRLFHQVVGQEHITRTLQNQVSSGHIGHAYLFCGSRGTGKTSTARILARAINCLEPDDGEPCGVCESCLITGKEDAVDIIELDAASNNGVDDMRMLLEKARFTPLHLKYKVYIIDEVHMVTSGAFNALLKTLEEPPPHVVFILATTEPQKLPATVVSRCQRFDFHRLRVRDITGNLKHVLHEAGASMDEEALGLIARAADGGMRDALSLADQCLSFCTNTITAQDVYDVLGCMDEDFLFEMADNLFEGNAAGALTLLDRVVMNGRDLGVFLQDLSAHIRALLLTKACGDCMELLDCTKDAMARYQAQAAAASEAGLLRAMEQLMRVQSDMRYLRQPRALVESVLVRLCRPEDATELLALEDRLARLERRMESGFPAAVSVMKPVPVVKAPVPIEDNPPWDDAPPLPEFAPPVDDPPWDTPAPAAKPVQKPASEAAPPKSAPKPASPQTTPIPVPKPAGGEATLQAFKKLMQTRNMSLFVLLQGATRADVFDRDLVIYFPPAQQSAMQALQVPRNLSVLTSALKAIDESLHLILRTEDAAPVPAEELSKLFGDKLVIEE